MRLTGCRAYGALGPRIDAQIDMIAPGFAVILRTLVLLGD